MWRTSRVPVSVLAFVMLVIAFIAISATRDLRAATARASSAIVWAHDVSLTRTTFGARLRDGKPFTGTTVDRDPDFGSQTESPYVNGLRDGIERAWFANGVHMYERAYVRGQEHGTHRGWYADGRLHFLYEYSDGVMQGLAREWYPNGQLYREFHYAAGHEDGAQQMWFPDGSLRANYVMKSGRRYGLPGSKGCTGTTLNAPSADVSASTQPE